MGKIAKEGGGFFPDAAADRVCLDEGGGGGKGVRLFTFFFGELVSDDAADPDDAIKVA